MIPRPDMFPVWAALDQVDPVSNQNNVLVPPLEKQNYGWNRLEFPPRNFFNWLGRKTYQWLQYLDQQQAQSTVTTGSGAAPIVDIINGGMSLIYVVDKGDTTKFFEGIVYVPAGYSSGTLTYNIVSTSTPSLTISAINSSGVVSISGGTGPYLVYGQMKN